MKIDYDSETYLSNVKCYVKALQVSMFVQLIEILQKKRSYVFSWRVSPGSWKGFTFTN